MKRFKCRCMFYYWHWYQCLSVWWCTDQNYWNLCVQCSGSTGLCLCCGPSIWCLYQTDSTRARWSSEVPMLGFTFKLRIISQTTCSVGSWTCCLAVCSKTSLSPERSLATQRLVLWLNGLSRENHSRMEVDSSCHCVSILLVARTIGNSHCVCWGQRSGLSDLPRAGWIWSRNPFEYSHSCVVSLVPHTGL